MLKVVVWYIWHYVGDYNPNWRSSLAPGLNLAMSRLQAYTGTSWSYSFKRSFRTTCVVGAGQAISYSDAINIVRELAQSDPYFQADYRMAELPIFIFANTGGALSVDYRSPIYGSDKMVLLENTNRSLTLIEHEIGHTFSLPDHMQPFSNPLFDNCIMGNLYLGGVRFGNECSPRFIRGNYHKESYESLIGYETKSLNFAWYGAYATWQGLSGISPITPPSPIIWPANTEITIVWQFGITGNYIAPITVEFFNIVSYPVILEPGSSGEAITIIPPKGSGTYQTELVVRAGNMVIGREPVIIPLEMLSPGDLVMREQAVVTFTEEGYANGNDIPIPPEYEFNITPVITIVMMVMLAIAIKGIK